MLADDSVREALVQNLEPVVWWFLTVRLSTNLQFVPSDDLGFIV